LNRIPKAALAALQEAAGPEDVETAWARVRDRFDALFQIMKTNLLQAVRSLASVADLVERRPRSELPFYTATCC
jgi:hypothetical protein